MKRVLGLLIVATLVVASLNTIFAQDDTQRTGVVVKLAGEVVESFENLAEAIPSEWRASSESAARYGILLTGFTSEGKTCVYVPAATLIRTQIDIEAVITDLVTGEIIASERFIGYMPNCPLTTRGSGNTYARPPLGAVIAWLFATMTAHADLGDVPLILPHRTTVTTASYSPDGRVVLTGTADISGIGPEHESVARLWDAVTGAELLQLDGHSGGIGTAIFSPDGTTILTIDGDMGRLWDAETGGMLLEIADISGAAASFSPDGRAFLTVAHRSYLVQLWDIATGEELLRLSKDAHRVDSASFSPDGRTIVTVSSKDGATMWDTQTGDEIFYLPWTLEDTTSAGQEPVRLITDSAVFSPDGYTILTTGQEARVWNAITGQELLQLTGHKQQVFNAIFNPDGTTILTTDVDTGRLWDAETGNIRCQFEGPGGHFTEVVFSPDGRYILTEDFFGLRLWDAVMCHELRHLPGGVTSASFSPDGYSLLTTSTDQTARIWDISALVNTP